MSDSSNASSGGIGFFGALGLLFIGLKLGHVIDWDWWLVTLPLWGGLAIALAVLICIGAALLFYAIVESIWPKKPRWAKGKW